MSGSLKQPFQVHTLIEKLKKSEFSVCPCGSEMKPVQGQEVLTAWLFLVFQ